MAILDRVAQITGKGFEFRETDKDLTEPWASVKVARADMPDHVVLYHPSHRDKLGYLVAHECGHIIRLHESPPEYKKLAATGPEHRRVAARDLEEDLYRLARTGLSIEHLGQLVQIWHEGLVRQLGNAPVDMRIERWMHRGYDGLRLLQSQALTQQLSENARALGRRVQEFTPEKVYLANVTMNAAFARYMGLLLEAEYWSRYAGAEGYQTGMKLADEIWNSPDSGYQGDVAAIESWSHALGLDGWWKWQRI